MCVFCGGGGGDFILCFHSFTSLPRDVFSADFFLEVYIIPALCFFFYLFAVFVVVVAAEDVW